MTVGSYSEATKLANGSCVKSALVHVGGHSWRVVFYPNGRLAGTTGFMSLYLLMDEDEGDGAAAAAAGEDVHVMFSATWEAGRGVSRPARSPPVGAGCRNGCPDGDQRAV